MTKLIFDVGDIVLTNQDGTLKGQIVALRSETGFARVPGHLCQGADILTADGRMRFMFLHDIARYNPGKLKVLA